MSTYTCLCSDLSAEGDGSALPEVDSAGGTDGFHVWAGCSSGRGDFRGNTNMLSTHMLTRYFHDVSIILTW